MKKPDIAVACVAVVACISVQAETFDQLAQRCAPDVHPQTLRKLATVESSGNPFAIGVVGDALPRQPRTKQEALAAIRELEAQGRNFSVGVVQINRYNVPRYGHTYESILEPCNNVRVGAKILNEGFALSQADDEQLRAREALSRYYSGNARRGFLPDKPGGTSYVQRVAASAGNVPAYVVPALEPHPSDAVAGPPQRQGASDAPVKVWPVTAIPAARQADPWMVTIGAPAEPGEALPAGDWMVMVK